MKAVGLFKQREEKFTCNTVKNIEKHQFDDLEITSCKGAFYSCIFEY